MKQECNNTLNNLLDYFIEQVNILKQENEKLRKENYELRQTYYHEDVVKKLKQKWLNKKGGQDG